MNHILQPNNSKVYGKEPDITNPPGYGEHNMAVKKYTERLILKVKICNKNLPDISVCKTNLLQGLEEYNMALRYSVPLCYKQLLTYKSQAYSSEGLKGTPVLLPKSTSSDKYIRSPNSHSLFYGVPHPNPLLGLTTTLQQSFILPHNYT